MTSNSDRIRLAFVITELSVGGAERCLTRLATELDPARFAVSVHSLASRPGSDRAELVNTLERQRIPLQFLNADRKSQFLSAVRQLSHQFCDDPPDVVQSFLYHANVVASVAARRAGIRRLCTGIRVAEPSWLRRRIEARTTRDASRIVCVSDAVADEYRRNVPRRKDSVVVIPNGIDQREFELVPPVDRTPFGIPDDAPLLISAGRLAPQKRLGWLVQRIPQLLQRIPNAHWAIAGSGPELPALEQLSRKTSVDRHVHFLGWQPDLRPWYSAADVLLLSSSYEGMPNVVMEAMASGLPVVCTRAHGVDQLLGPLADSQAVGLGDGESFIRRVEAIVSDPELARQLGEANRGRISDHFSLRDMVESYATLYENVRAAGEV